MLKKKQNILVIGSTNHVGATCVDWGDSFYVGDFDYLIVNVPSLTQEKMLTILDADKSYFETLRRDIIDVQQRTEISIACISEKYVFSANKEYLSNNNNKNLIESANNYSWCPIIPVFKIIAPSKKINTGNAKYFLKYISQVKSAELLYDNLLNKTGYLPYDGTNTGYYVRLYSDPVLFNDAGECIAFFTTWKLYKRYISSAAFESKPILFLPKTENNHDGIDILIKELIKEKQIEEPDWSKQIQLFGEDNVKKKLIDYRKKLDQIREDGKIIKKELKDLRHFKKVLYSQGIELENVVSDIFSKLGLDLEKPEITNLEDRFILDKDKNKIYIEIRGVNRTMSETDLNQLVGRIADKPVSKQYKTRGVFVFNHLIQSDPKNRSSAFHNNIEIQAKVHNICLIDTQTLFEIFNKKLIGEDINFKDKVLNTIGIFKLDK